MARTFSVAPWLEVAETTGPPAVSGCGDDRRERVGAAGVAAATAVPSRSSAPNEDRHPWCALDQAARMTAARRSSSRSNSASLHSRSFGSAHRIARLPLPAGLGDAHAVHEVLDVAFVQHRAFRARRSTPGSHPLLAVYPRGRGIVPAP